MDAGPRLRATGAPPAHLPARCIALAEGYPLGFMPGYQGVHEIDRLALMKDWAQWPPVATSALHAFEVLRRARIVPIRHWRAQA